MKTFKNSLILIALCVVASCVASCKNKAQKHLEKSAKEYNDQCPIMITKYIRMDSCLAAPDLTLRYVGTLLSLDAEEADFQPEILSANSKKNILRSLQGKPSFEIFKKYKIKIQYVYYDAKGNLLYEVLITPEDYDKVLEGDGTEDELNLMLETAKLEVQGIQKQLPLNMGNGVVMTDVYFSETEKMFKYTIALANAKKIKSEIEAFTASARTSIIANLTKEQETAALLKHGFIFCYLYTDPQGELLSQIDVTKDDL